MSGPVTLVLGSGSTHPSLPHTVAREAKKRGHTVVLATPHPDPSSESTPLDLHDFESYTSAFDLALSNHKRIDNVLLVFTPPEVTRSEVYIPGAEQSAVDDVVLPLMKALKIGFYHFRRGASPGKPKMTIFAARGHDVDTRTSFNAVLGLYRSVVPRAKAIGVGLELVVGDVTRAESADGIVSAILAPACLTPSVHIVSAQGKATTQAHTVGQCWSSAIMVLHGRFVPLAWLKEKVTMLQIRVRPFLQGPPGYASAATQLSWLLLHFVLVTFIGYATVKGNNPFGPFTSFVFAFFASRYGPLTTTAPLVFLAWRGIWRGKA